MSIHIHLHPTPKQFPFSELETFRLRKKWSSAEQSNRQQNMASSVLERGTVLSQRKYTVE